VIWLYDLYATRYDRIKQFQPEYDHFLLANPIMGYIAPHQSPLVLDVAVGTGRLPDALFKHAYFHGRIIGLDLSTKMLRIAAQKLGEDQNRLSLLRAPAEQVPFDDNSFDVVTCLESLEFMPDSKVVISELARVLRPGGLLLITNRIGRHFMPSKTFNNETLVEILNINGICDVEIEPWQEDYHRVWGLKGGDSLIVGARPLVEVLRCPACGGHFTINEAGTWSCMRCNRKTNPTTDGILDVVSLYS